MCLCVVRMVCCRYSVRGRSETQEAAAWSWRMRWAGWSSPTATEWEGELLVPQVDGPPLPPLPDNERTEVLTAPQEKE